jgi:AMMECR1 domain-containing protein
MNTLARTILENYLFEKKKMNPADVKENSPVYKEKLPVFVTVYDGETIVASSGRIYPACETALEELIENTI